MGRGREVAELPELLALAEHVLELGERRPATGGSEIADTWIVAGVGEDLPEGHDLMDVVAEVADLRPDDRPQRVGVGTGVCGGGEDRLLHRRFDVGDDLGDQLLATGEVVGDERRTYLGSSAMRANVAWA
jgi:hypothetical protein